MGTRRFRHVVVPAVLVIASVGVTGCSSSTTSPSASPSAAQSTSTLTATCQKLATILAPYLGSGQIAFASMTAAQQQQTLQTVANGLQAEVSTADPQVQAQIAKLQQDLTAMIPYLGNSATPSPSEIKTADQFEKQAENLMNACKAVGVNIGPP